MKKLLIIVVACTLHTHFTQGMLNLTENLKAAVHYADKWINPEAYVLDSQNVKLYQSVLEAFDEKDISELRITQFKDGDDVFHNLESTLGKRVASRLTTLITCLLQQSLIQDPVKRDDTKLSDMIAVNRLIIPDLYLALALRSLQEQKKPKTPVSNTGSLIVDVLLHKIDLLSEAEQFLLKSKLQENTEFITVDQKRSLAETYFLSLPEGEQEKLLLKMSEKKSPAITILPVKEKSPEHSASSIPGSFGKEDSVELRPTNKKRMALVNNNSQAITIDNGSYDGSNVMVDNISGALQAEIDSGDVYEG